MKQPDERVQRLKEHKKRIRAEYSRLPWVNWMAWARSQKEQKPPVTPEPLFERNDVLAIILAVLSLVLPWALAFFAGLGLLIFLVSLLFG